MYVRMYSCHKTVAIFFLDKPYTKRRYSLYFHSAQVRSNIRYFKRCTFEYSSCVVGDSVRYLFELACVNRSRKVGNGQ